MTTDDQLDDASLQLLRAVRELNDIEQRKRETPRSSEEFHRLAAEAEAKALEVWDVAREERDLGEQPSPDASERAEKSPGDWTR
jgi:hypothetical protein